MQTLTLREALKNMACLMVAGLMPGINDTHIRYRIPDRLLDLRIIGGALVALDTEEAEQIIMLIENAAYHDNSAYMSEEDAVNAILTACMPGIIVPDEVVDAAIGWDEDDDDVPRFFFRRYGMDALVKPYADDDPDASYTITITRKSSGSPNSCQNGNDCTGKSILHPPVNEGE